MYLPFCREWPHIFVPVSSREVSDNNIAYIFKQNLFYKYLFLTDKINHCLFVTSVFNVKIRHMVTCFFFSLS